MTEPKTKEFYIKELSREAKRRLEAEFLADELYSALWHMVDCTKHLGVCEGSVENANKILAEYKFWERNEIFK